MLFLQSGINSMKGEETFIFDDLLSLKKLIIKTIKICAIQ